MSWYKFISGSFGIFSVVVTPIRNTYSCGNVYPTPILALSFAHVLTIHQTISDQHPQQSIRANHQPKQPIGRGPIRVAPKAKRSRRPQNVFMDDHGFPDQPMS